MGVKMLDTEYRHRNNEIYFHFGGRNQLEQAKSENYEVLDALQKFILKPYCKERLENIKNEIADKLVMSEQMEFNSTGTIRNKYLEHSERFTKYIEEEGLELILNLVIDGYREDIKEIIKQKIDRTLERIESRYYEKL